MRINRVFVQYAYKYLNELHYIYRVIKTLNRSGIFLLPTAVCDDGTQLQPKYVAVSKLIKLVSYATELIYILVKITADWHRMQVPFLVYLTSGDRQ